MNGFEKLGIDEDFNPLYPELGITKPNEVQKKIIPKILNQNSIIGLAQTGSGKTLSYALPVSELIKQIEDDQGLSQKRSKPFAVIILPTKELALQVNDIFKSISHHVKLRIRTLVGTQKNSLKNQSYEVLIATPTKLARSLSSGEVSFDQLKYLVFDEADNLFEMGFKKDIDKIMARVEYSSTDIHFFSATMPLEVEEFLQAKFAKKKLEKIQIGTHNKIQSKIETFNIFLEEHEKENMLRLFIEKTAKGRGIVFCNQKNQVIKLSSYLSERMPKLKFKTIHGDLAEKERITTINSFKAKKSQVLVATDIVARGIDIKDIDWILNFNLPKTPIYYIHRSGRTARSGRSGKVFNFVTKFDSKVIAGINESIRSQSEIKMELLQDKATRAPRKMPKSKKKEKRVKITKRTKLK